MDSMIINRRDLDFLLYDYIGVQELTGRERFRDHSRETFDAAIETAIVSPSNISRPTTARTIPTSQNLMVSG